MMAIRREAGTQICPDCGAVVRTGSSMETSCDVCHATLLVSRGSSRLRDVQVSGAGISDRDLDDGIRKLLEQKRMIEAVKYCRTQTTWSLKDSKDRVDDVALHMGISLSSAPTGSTCAAAILVFLVWIAAVILLPGLVHRAVLDMAGHLSGEISLGIYAGTVVLVLLVTILAIRAWARWSSRFKNGFPRKLDQG